MCKCNEKKTMLLNFRKLFSSGVEGPIGGPIGGPRGRHGAEGGAHRGSRGGPRGGQGEAGGKAKGGPIGGPRGFILIDTLIYIKLNKRQKIRNRSFETPKYEIEIPNICNFEIRKI